MLQRDSTTNPDRGSKTSLSLSDFSLISMPYGSSMGLCTTLHYLPASFGGSIQNKSLQLLSKWAMMHATPFVDHFL